MSWQIPQGIEVLVKKASVDAEFRELLLAKRAEAAGEIGLPLDEAEAAMLAAVPEAQLQAIIAGTTVPQEHRRAFLGKAAAAMLAALGTAGTGLAAASGLTQIQGIQPDRPPPRIPPPLQTGPDIDAQVIGVIAKELGRSEQGISPQTNLAKDLQADAQQREAIRTALQQRFDIVISGETFEKFQVVRDVVRYVDVAAVAQRQVIEVVAKELGIGREQITHEKSLLDDLHVSAAQRAGIKRELAKKFRVYVSWEEFKKLRTVGDVVSYMGGIVLRQQAAKVPKEPPAIPSPVTRGSRPDVPMSRGIRPDVPPIGGIRPGSPPPRR